MLIDQIDAQCITAIYLAAVRISVLPRILVGAVVAAIATLLSTNVGYGAADAAGAALLALLRALVLLALLALLALLTLLVLLRHLGLLGLVGLGLMLAQLHCSAIIAGVVDCKP